MLLGVAGSVLLGLRALRVQRATFLEAQAVRVVSVAVAAAFPLLYFIVARPVAYNGMRHFLFVLPPLSVLAALAFDRAFDELKVRWMRVALALGLALAGIAQVRGLVALYPEQYVYFNSLVGGPAGAQGRYELDYWGTSLAEATRGLEHELERSDQLPDPGETPLKVYVCGNVWSAATYFPPGLKPVESLASADFQIAINEFFCKPAPGSRRLFEVTRAGALLSFVDDLRAPPRAQPNNGFARGETPPRAQR
jgi:hypothetical protein